MLHLPLEIIDLILSELYVASPLFEESPVMVNASRGKAALNACTLVCRAWKPIATSLLFRHIRYSFTYDLTLLDDAIGRGGAVVPDMRWTFWLMDEAMPHKMLEQFHTFVSQNPSIGRSIRGLLLRGYAVDDDTEEEYRVDAGVFTSLLNLLPNLHTLKLMGIALIPASMSPDALFTPVHPLGSVIVDYGTLEELDFNPYTQADVARLLSCFSDIEELSIVTSEVDNNNLVNFIDLQQFRPRALALAGACCPSALLARIFQTEGAMQAIRSLHLLHPTSNTLQRTSELYLGAAKTNSTLEELKICTKRPEPLCTCPPLRPSHRTHAPYSPQPCPV